MPSVQKIFDTKQMRICIYKAKSRVKSGELRGSQDSASARIGLQLQYGRMPSCRVFLFSIFFSHIPKFLFGSEQINKTLKPYLKRADHEYGTVCCVQHCSTKSHKEKGTMWITFGNCTSEQISQHFPGGEKNTFQCLGSFIMHDEN